MPSAAVAASPAPVLAAMPAMTASRARRTLCETAAHAWALSACLHVLGLAACGYYLPKIVISASGKTCVPVLLVECCEEPPQALPELENMPAAKPATPFLMPVPEADPEPESTLDPSVDIYAPAEAAVALDHAQAPDTLPSGALDITVLMQSRPRDSGSGGARTALGLGGAGTGSGHGAESGHGTGSGPGMATGTGKADGPPVTATAAGAASTQAVPAGFTRGAGLLGALKPVYPEAQRKAGSSASVLLEVRLDAQGKPVEIKVLTTEVPKDFVHAAAAAARKARFQPALENGIAVPGFVRIKIHFKLE